MELFDKFVSLLGEEEIALKDAPWNYWMQDWKRRR